MGARSAFDADFAVRVGSAPLGREKQIAGAAGREPAGEELRAVTRGARGFGKQDFGPPPDVPQLRRATPQERDRRTLPGGRPEKVGQGMIALREDIGEDARLVVQQRAFVRVRRWGIHPGAQVHEHARFAVSALDDGRRGLGAQPRRMHQVVLVEDPDGRGPLQSREGLIEGAPYGVVVGNQTRRLPRALEEVRECVGTIIERPDDPRGCGNGHEGIITQCQIREIEEG